MDDHLSFCGIPWDMIMDKGDKVCRMEGNGVNTVKFSDEASQLPIT